jgi:predicted permease
VPLIPTVIGWSACLALGLYLQRRLRDPGRLSHVLFAVMFWVTEPLLVFFAYTTVHYDAGLLAVGAVVVTSSWLVLGLGVGFGRLTSRHRRERGAVALGSALGNTSYVGFPLAIAVFGPAGLALAVLYSEFQFLIPSLAVSRAVARHYAGPDSLAQSEPGLWSLARGWLVNPLVASGAVALALRLSGVDLHHVVAPLGPPAGLAVGMFGFFQLGLATPLEPLAHRLADLPAVLATLALRCAVAPLLLLSLSHVAGVHVPGVCLLLAATPVAFNPIILARVFDLDAAMLRLVVAISTPLVIVGVLIGHTFW